MVFKMVENYIEFLKENKNRSQNTCKSYHHDLVEFHNWLLQQYPSTIFNKDFYKNITISDMDAFVRYLKRNKLVNGKIKKGNSAASINRKQICIKEFWKFLQRNDYINENIAEKLELVKIPERLHEWLSEEQVVNLINTIASNTKDRFRVRNSTIVLLFIVTGLRVSELCNIRLSDIKDGMLYCVGKGNKERKIPLSISTLKTLNKYLDDKKQNGFIDTEYLFVSKSGSKLATTDIDYMLKKYSKKCNINISSMSAHKLRHSFASISYIKNVDIRSLQLLLGHSSIKTTEIYAHQNDKILQESINKNPLAHLNIDLAQ